MTTTEGAVVDPARGLGGMPGGVPATITTACTNEWCPAHGVARQIWLKQVAVGVVAVPALLCARCAHVLPVSFFEENPMPKLHVGRPPTDKNDIPAGMPPSAKTAVSEPEAAMPADAGTEPAQEAAPEPEPAETGSGEQEQSTSDTPAAAAKKAARKAVPRKKAGDS